MSPIAGTNSNRILAARLQKSRRERDWPIFYPEFIDKYYNPGKLINMSETASEAGDRECIAFQGAKQVAHGSLKTVALAARQALDAEPARNVLIFDAMTSAPVEVDLRGTDSEIIGRLVPHEAAPKAAEAPPERRGRGRPKLGVVAHEVTLLPRHWDWLKQQPGGASVTLRRLVETARKSSSRTDQHRADQGATYQFMVTMAGNESGFEEASRALFAENADLFNQHIQLWPPDIRNHTQHLAQRAFASYDSDSENA